MKENMILRFLYRCPVGRFFLKLFISPGISKLGGKVLNSGLSKFYIRPFIKKNKISLVGIEIEEEGFSSFNHFFKRKRKADLIRIDRDEESFISPCDAFLSVFDISDTSVFKIKGVPYSLTGLLRERKLGESFKGGKALVFRLTPSHYHRYLYAESGKVIFEKKIDGELHCVRPIAMEKFPVFIQNSREYLVTETRKFGRLIQMEVGALMVGKISNHEHGDFVTRGEEKGCFEFGGSTIILLVQKDKLELESELLEMLSVRDEVSVFVGQKIGSTGKEF